MKNQEILHIPQIKEAIIKSVANSGPITEMLPQFLKEAIPELVDIRKNGWIKKLPLVSY